MTRGCPSYPLSCIRLQPVHCCPRVNLQGAIYPFISDLRDRLQSICGLPVCMTSKPCYHTSSLTSSGSAQVCNNTHAHTLTHTYTHSNTLRTQTHKLKSCTCKPHSTFFCAIISQITSVLHVNSFLKKAAHNLQYH